MEVCFRIELLRKNLIVLKISHILVGLETQYCFEALKMLSLIKCLFILLVQYIFIVILTFYIATFCFYTHLLFDIYIFFLLTMNYCH